MYSCFNELADEEPLSLADVEMAATLVDKREDKLWNCDVLGLTVTFWLRLAVAL